MNKKVSILILENNSEYTQRCIASINNQTYREIEIWLLGAVEQKYESNFEIKQRIVDNTNYTEILNDSMSKAAGKLIFVVKSTFVLSTTCLEVLLQNERNVGSALILYDGLSGLVQREEDGFLIYGKLFETEKIRENHVKLTGLLAEDQLEFLLQMSLHNKKCESDNKAFIYALAEEFQYDMNCNFIIEMYKKYGILLAQYSKSLIRCCNLDSESDLKRIQFVVNLYPCIRQNIKENIRIAECYIRPIVEKLRCSTDKEQEYEELKKYFKLIEDEVYKNTLYDILGCTSVMLSLYMDLDYESYMYCIRMQNKYMIKNTDKNAEIQEMNTKISRMEKHINTEMRQIKETIACNTNNSKKTENIEDIYGTELIDFTLRCYEDGKLGFRTILRSIKSWFKHKLS